MEFPKYANGLYLSSVRDGIAVYRRPDLTGRWSLEAQIKSDKVICTYCLAENLIGKELKEMTEEEFLSDNGNLPLEVLLRNYE